MQNYGQFIILFTFIFLTNEDPIIFGASLVNSDKANLYDNIIEITYAPEKLILYGINLSRIEKIGFSLINKKYGENCNDNKIPFYLTLTKLGEDDNLGILNIDKDEILPLNQNLYLCSNEVNFNNSWIHQDNILILKFFEPSSFLPLWSSIILLVILFSFSGLFSGLNLGLMALTPKELDILKVSGNKNERKYAAQIYPIRKKGNILLCAILVSITLFNAAATVIIDSITASILAVVISTVAILLFGELLPQSICSRFGLIISAKTRILTEILLLITWPVSFPLGKILDLILGDETPTSFNRQQLVEVLKLNKDGELDRDEVDIIFGGLELKNKTVEEVMTPLNDCFMIEEKVILDFSTLTDIVKSGFSRIPVYRNEKTDVIGILYLKDMTFLDATDKVPLENILKFYNHTLVQVTKDTTLHRLLRVFKKGTSHIAMVGNKKTDDDIESPSFEVIGLITLEDIIEEIIKSEIIDEKDCDKVKIMGGTLKYRKIGQTISITDSCTKLDYPKLNYNIVSTLCEFMSTTIQPFIPKYISSEVLKKLISLKGIAVNFPSEPGEEYLYSYNTPADYFSLIIEGKVEVTIGTENHVYVDGSLSHFGQTALDPDYAMTTDIKDTTITKNFIPDFSVKVIGTALILRIPITHYDQAIRLTKHQHENKQNATETQENLSIGSFTQIPRNC